MKKILSCVLLLHLCASTNSNCMQKQKKSRLNAIEQQLVIRKIEKQGVEQIENDIELAAISEQQSILTIYNKFYIAKKDQDSLTSLIFNYIESIENNSSDSVQKNLGKKTSYYWVDNRSAVKVKATLTNKEEILEIINAYKKNMPQRINVEKIVEAHNKELYEVINDLNIPSWTGLLSAATLLYYTLGIIEIMAT